MLEQEKNTAAYDVNFLFNRPIEKLDAPSGL